MAGEGITLAQSKLQSKLPGFNPANIITIIQAILAMLGGCPAPTPPAITPVPPAGKRFGLRARLAIGIVGEDPSMTLVQAFEGAEAAFAVHDEASDAEKSLFMSDAA